ncbi:MAG: hypothetical protein U0838_13115 [Chloroflexota bacterium]
MAWSNSKIFSAFVTDALNRTNAFDLNADTPKVSLHNNSITPDQTAAAASTAFNAGQWTTTNEVTDASGWPSGGRPLASITSTFASNVYTFDAADTASANSSTTLAGVYGCLVYDDTLASVVVDQGISFHYFGGAQSVTAGTFTVVWNASGILAITL